MDVMHVRRYDPFDVGVMNALREHIRIDRQPDGTFRAEFRASYRHRAVILAAGPRDEVIRTVDDFVDHMAEAFASVPPSRF